MSFIILYFFHLLFTHLLRPLFIYVFISICPIFFLKGFIGLPGEIEPQNQQLRDEYKPSGPGENTSVNGAHKPVGRLKCREQGLEQERGSCSQARI